MMRNSSKVLPRPGAGLRSSYEGGGDGVRWGTVLKGKRAALAGFISPQTGGLEPLVAVTEGVSPAGRIRFDSG